MDMKQFLIDSQLPLPGTILYAPLDLDKVQGVKLIEYTIDNEGMVGVIELGKGAVEVRVPLERIRMYTWKDKDDILMKEIVKNKWITSYMGCVINCSNCGERLELCYPDGTEVRALPYCPYCGAKME